MLSAMLNANLVERAFENVFSGLTKILKAIHTCLEVTILVFADLEEIFS